MTTGYAVLDTETTGFTPGWHRVVEVGVVLLDEAGAVEGEWCTLINPERDLGPQHVHGISAAEVRDAPVFADIAGDLAARLEGRVLVGHNLPFDVDFLAFEYARLGLDVPLAVMPGLCTMQLSERYLDISARSLAACCAAVDVPLTAAHSAQHDAYATAGLLVSYLQSAGRPVPWSDLLASASQWQWSSALPIPSGRTAHRGAVVGPREHFLTRLPEHGARSIDPGALDAYLTRLDAALLDRHLSLSEEDGLVENALSAGLGRVQVLGAHRRYLSVVACAAAQEGALPAAVIADLVTIAALIGLSAVDVDRARCHAVRELSILGSAGVGGSGAGMGSAAAPATYSDSAESATSVTSVTSVKSATSATSERAETGWELVQLGGQLFPVTGTEAVSVESSQPDSATAYNAAAGPQGRGTQSEGRGRGLGARSESDESAEAPAAAPRPTAAEPSIASVSNGRAGRGRTRRRGAVGRATSTQPLGTQRDSVTKPTDAQPTEAKSINAEQTDAEQTDVEQTGVEPTTTAVRRSAERVIPARKDPTTVESSGTTAENAVVSKPGPQTWGRFRLCTGDRVVFTGQTRSPRERWTSRTVSAGLVELNHVTRKTRLVVAADPDSLSGKARRARNYGIPIVTEEAFTRLLEKLLGSDPPRDPV